MSDFVDLRWGASCPETLLPMLGREVCPVHDGYGNCDLARSHNSWHAEVSLSGLVLKTWR
jgi:hypothetical protein